MSLYLEIDRAGFLPGFIINNSPPLADFISNNDDLRGVVRCTLYPAVKLSYVALHTSFAQKILIMLLPWVVVSSVLLLMWRRMKDGLGDGTKT